jgi:hypothetical protein
VLLALAVFISVIWFLFDVAVLYSLARVFAAGFGHHGQQPNRHQIEKRMKARWLLLYHVCYSVFALIMLAGKEHRIIFVFSYSCCYQ